MIFRTFAAVFLALSGALLYGAVASAVTVDPNGPYFNTLTCSTTDVGGTAIDCYGLVEPVPTNAQQVGVNTGTFYDGATTASTSTTGLFGITNWLDIYSASSGSLASFGSTTGVFDIAANLTGSVAVMLKAGNTWVSYLYNGLAAGSYTFDLLAAGTGNALSNIRIISTNPIPLPAALPLLAGALGGLAWVGRRRRKAA